NSECSSDQWCFRMQYLKSIGVLVVEPLFFKNSPDFLRGEFARSFHQVLRDLGPAVGETFKVALCRVVGQVLLGECQQLPVKGTGRQQDHCAQSKNRSEERRVGKEWRA